MEQYSYISTHPLGHIGPVTGTLYLYLYLNPLINLHTHNGDATLQSLGIML